MRKKFVYVRTLAMIGVAYLGSVSQSMKLALSEKNKAVLTYGVYLAPANMSGYEVCPNSQYCREFCLNGSGHNKVDILAGKNRIQTARIRKTRFLFENRDLFVQVLIHEIKKWQRVAEKRGMEFAVRFNCTSDVSPLFLVDPETGKNILELFPEVQFYDYTKVKSRFSICRRYPNYDLTYSYNGHNEADCMEVLANGGKVAVVFSGNKLPKTFWNYPVEDGNNDDVRYKNSPSSVIGLHYHPVANDYKVIKGVRTYIEPDTPFVVKPTDERCEW
jgi:hypothetical protein